MQFCSFIMPHLDDFRLFMISRFHLSFFIMEFDVLLLLNELQNTFHIGWVGKQGLCSFCPFTTFPHLCLFSWRKFCVKVPMKNHILNHENIRIKITWLSDTSKLKLVLNMTKITICSLTYVLGKEIHKCKHLRKVRATGKIQSWYTIQYGGKPDYLNQNNIYIE